MNILTFSQIGHRKLEFFVDRSVESTLFLPPTYSGQFSASTSGSDQYIKYKCDDGSSDSFMNILVYLRSNAWTAVTSTAHNDASSQKLIKTFYFERPNDGANVVVEEEDPWLEMQDNGETYYYNTVTGESAWEKPAPEVNRSSVTLNRDTIPADAINAEEIAAMELKEKREKEEKEEKERKEREERERLERERKEREDQERKERERKEREEQERKEKERKEIEERERKEKEERERQARELKELKEKEERERKEREAKKDGAPMPPKYELNTFRIPGGGNTAPASTRIVENRPISGRTRTVNAPPPPDLSKRPSLGSEAGVPPPPGVSPQKRLSQQGGAPGGVFAPPPPGGGRRLSAQGGSLGPPPPPPGNGEMKGKPPTVMSLSSTTTRDTTDAIANKNAEHFRKMAEQEEEEKAALERQRRAKMSAEELAEEEQAQSAKEEHEKQKSQAMARLGGTFATSRGGAALFSGGRGRGRGRGRGGL